MRRFVPAVMVLSVALFVLTGVALAQTEASAVEVTLTEYEIDMPTSLPPGPTTFQVTNSGTEEHNFEIEGQGIEEAFEANLQPGETMELQVDLQPGTYEVYCPVDGHREEGMELALTVAAAQTTPTAGATVTATVTGTATAEVTATQTPTAAPAGEVTATATTTAPTTLPTTGAGSGFSWPLAVVLLVAGALLIVSVFALRPRLR